MIELIVKSLFFSILVYLIREFYLEERRFLRLKEYGFPERASKGNLGNFFNFKKIGAKLDQAGNPFNIKPGGFIALKILLPLVGLSFHLGANTSILYYVGTIFFNFFLPDIFLILVNWDRKREIAEELPDIVDIFEVATTAGIDIGEVFQLATNYSNGKEVKRELTRLSAEYALTLDKETALDNFGARINLLKTDLLVGALKQQDITGKSKNLLKAISLLHANERISKYQRKAKIIQYKVLFACALMAFSIAIIYFYPYFSGLEKGLLNIF